CSPWWPVLPRLRRAYVHVGTVLFGRAAMAAGRGTPDPSMPVGAPGTTVATSHIAPLRRSFQGVNIERISFRPRSIPGKAPHPDFEGEQCRGIGLQITNLDLVEPVRLGVQLLATMLDATPEAKLSGFVEKLSGIDKSKLLQQ